jgi:hypothetical protein
VLAEIVYVEGCFLSLEKGMTEIETAIAFLNATKATTCALQSVNNTVDYLEKVFKEDVQPVYCQFAGLKKCLYPMDFLKNLLLHP